MQGINKELDASQLHMLSVQTIIIKNPEPDFNERMRILKEECEMKWELKMEEYAKNK